MVAGFDFADIFDDVVDRAGGEQSTAADVVRVRRGLRLLLERWEAQGYNTWRIRRLTTAVNGGAAARLSSSVDDVINVNAVRDCGTETPLTRITAAEYAQLSDKTSPGQPSQYWLSREADAPVLLVYPIGPSKLNVTYVERPADFDRYSADLGDVPGRWLEAMIAGLALDLARKRPPYDEGLINRLSGEALEAEGIAQRADRDRARYRYKIAGRRL